MGFAPLFDLYATFVDVSGLPSYVAPNGVLHMVSHVLSVCFESSTQNSVGASASWKGLRVHRILGSGTLVGRIRRGFTVYGSD